MMSIDKYLVNLCQASASANRAFSGRITKSLLSEADAKMIERFSDYDHLSTWEGMEVGKQILAAQSRPAKKQ